VLAAAPPAPEPAPAQVAGDGQPAAVGSGSTDPNAPKADKPPPVLDPDNIDRTDLPPAEVKIVPSSPKAAAWASLCQALMGTAEFRYVK
jgi:hypothetical protein